MGVYSEEVICKELVRGRDEIKLNPDIFLVNKNVFSDWILLLEKADLIKYAKQPATITEMEKDKKKALDIIENIFIKE